MKWLLLLPLLLVLVLPVSAQDYLYPGVYAVTNDHFRYQGTWTDTQSTKGFRFSRTATAQYSAIEFQFYGTGWILHTRSAAGTMASIYTCTDGATCTLTDLGLGAVDNNRTIVKSGLTDGFHTGRITINSAALIFWFDYITITGSALPESNVNILSAPTLQANVLNFPPVQDVNISSSDLTNPVPLMPGYYDNYDNNITYTGSWNHFSYQSFSFRTVSHATAINAYARFFVYGEKITLEVQTDGTPYNFEYCVDGACLSHALPGDAFTIHNVDVFLGAGLHEITVKRTDGTTGLLFDGVTVHGETLTFAHWHIFAGALVAMITAAMGLPAQAIMYLLVIIFGASSGYYWVITFIYVVGSVIAYFLRSARK